MPTSRKRKKSKGPASKAATAAAASTRRQWRLTALITAVVIGGTLYWLGDSGNIDVEVPALTGAAVRGEALFVENCASCHGENAAGSSVGPPLVHRVYEPGHHPYQAFVAAVGGGVREHHWNFGNMPPVRSVSSTDLRSIVAYVRALQVANGIR